MDTNPSILQMTKIINIHTSYKPPLQKKVIIYQIYAGIEFVPNY